MKSSNARRFALKNNFSKEVRPIKAKTLAAAWDCVIEMSAAFNWNWHDVKVVAL